MDQFVQLLRAAQGGQGLENLAQIYGLTAQQAQKAAEAVMPAFAAGIQRAMQSPEGLASLMVLMMRGPYGGLYDRAPAAPDQYSQAGANALDALFGSPEISAAVANHAAASTGLATAVVRKIMPDFATLVMGGLTKSLAASGAMNQMLAAMLARANGLPVPTGNPWVDGLATWMNSAMPRQSQSTGNPWVDAFAQMMLQSPWTAGNAGAWGQSGMGAAWPGTARSQPNPYRAQAERSAAASQDVYGNAANAWQELIAAMMETMTAVSGEGASRQASQREVAAAAKPLALPPPPPPPEPLAALGQWPMQDYFAQLFAQGFPPTVGTGGNDPAAPFASLAAFYPFPDFWSQMLGRSAAHGHASPTKAGARPTRKG
ncbi:DUF937 domain-containing protein [Roseixanthobacter glucoisosaccharinicivorans]|uniref:DUF937 domain-containing protein n=1 Tax=Roseixanthobacter glucoisosaccharinicivorans TaxID=3119923 RepID=UPI00372C4950